MNHSPEEVSNCRHRNNTIRQFVIEIEYDEFVDP